MSGSKDTIGGADHLRIVGLGGSLRPNSYSYRALKHVMDLLARSGCQTHVVDLRTISLPFCNGDSKHVWSDFPGVLEMRTAVSRAHAVVLATPEYHGGMSGVLKNALDLLDSEHLKDKVAGLLSVMAGPASRNALDDMSKIMRSCHAWVMPSYIAIGHVHAVFVDGEIRDLDLQRRFAEFAETLVISTTRICGFGSTEKSQEFKNENLSDYPQLYCSAGKRTDIERADAWRASGKIQHPIAYQLSIGETS